MHLQDPAYRDAQPHIALALERLACNPATQYELVDCGVAAAVCRGLQGASPHAAASLSRAVLARAREGARQRRRRVRRRCALLLFALRAPPRLSVGSGQSFQYDLLGFGAG